MSKNPFRNRPDVATSIASGSSQKPKASVFLESPQYPDLSVSDEGGWSDTDESVGSATSTGNHVPSGNLEKAWWDKEESVNSVAYTGYQVPAGNSEEAWSDTDDSVNVVASTNDQVLTGDQVSTSDTVPGPNDVFIAVMGVTGSGKSSFIETCSGKSVKVGHDLESCTAEVQRYRYEMSPERAVWLIDTPGLDDTDTFDTEQLKKIAKYLADTYKAKIYLHGMIYLHRITDNRMTGSAKTHKTTFEKLCGKDALKRVILATTMWDDLKDLKKYKQAEMREKDLKQTERFWGYMLENGSSYHRYENTSESAQDIVKRLAMHDKPIVTALQKEIVDDHRTLIETSAGKALNDDILKVQEKYEKRLEAMEKEMRTADEERRTELQEDRDRMAQMIEEAKSSRQALDVTMSALVQRDQLINQMQRQMEMQHVENQNRVRQLEERQYHIEEEKNELERARRKERQKRRDEGRDREVQKARDKPHQSTGMMSMVMKRTKNWSKGSIILPYSISITANLYFASSGLQIRKTTAKPQDKLGSSYLSWVTFGTNSGKGGIPWMALYENGDWLMSSEVKTSYPNLEKLLSERGLSTLLLCVLGPNQSFYAEWYDSWAAAGPKSLMKKLESHKGTGLHVISISFGYGNSYVLSYGRRENLENLSTYWNLDGHYPALEKFLKERRPLNVVQIALDQRSTTDYVIIKAGKDGTYDCQILSNTKEVKEGILAWWDDSTPS